MTDRYKGLTVSLEKDTREDDAEYILNAIRMIRGVASVEGNVSTPEDHMNRQQVRAEIRDKLYALANEI